MQQFVNNIFNFFYSIYTNISSFIGGTGQGLTSMLTKPILDGSMISTPLSIQAIIMIVLPTITLFFFIVLIFKLFINIIGLFTK